MGNKYNTAVIGCGRIGSEFDDDPKRTYAASHAGAYDSVQKSDLVAVCDTDKKKLDKCVEKWKSPRGYTDYREMFTSEKIDIVSVCTPPASHHSVIKDILELGKVKAVFCEKPIAEDIDEALEIVDLCRKSNVILQIDHQRRFDQMHNQIRDLIQSKELGEVQQVNFYYTAGIKNTGSHMFDLLRFFFGDAEWIEAFPSRNSSGNEDDPNLDGLIKFNSGILATFQACDFKKFLIFEMNCIFGNGRIILKDSGFDADFFQVKDSELFTGYRDLDQADKPFKTDYQRDFMVNAVKHLIECVELGKKGVSRGEDGLEALNLIIFAEQSAKNNGERVFLK